MEQKTSLKLLVVFLGLSYVVSSTTTMLSGTLKFENENASQIQDSVAKEAMEVSSDSEELHRVEQAYIEGRMDMETRDYGGTGANNRHDPRAPKSG
ncbi:Transmembrane protein [Melia azedarach]|uniref:Transmembrane protein n=1 Tax=Melia azedarach TaxID=155640 RepID=A0ACC1XGR7_MELAZ|nr:Transmembrane protein [Melia azedarach]